MEPNTTTTDIAVPGNPYDFLGNSIHFIVVIIEHFVPVNLSHDTFKDYFFSNPLLLLTACVILLFALIGLVSSAYYTRKIMRRRLACNNTPHSYPSAQENAQMLFGARKGSTGSEVSNDLSDRERVNGSDSTAENQQRGPDAVGGNAANVEKDDKCSSTSSSPRLPNILNDGGSPPSDPCISKEIRDKSLQSSKASSPKLVFADNIKEESNNSCMKDNSERSSPKIMPESVPEMLRKQSSILEAGQNSPDKSNNQLGDQFGQFSLEAADLFERMPISKDIAGVNMPRGIIDLNPDKLEMQDKKIKAEVVFQNEGQHVTKYEMVMTTTRYAVKPPTLEDPYLDHLDLATAPEYWPECKKQIVPYQRSMPTQTTCKLSMQIDNDELKEFKVAPYEHPMVPYHGLPMLRDESTTAGPDSAAIPSKESKAVVTVTPPSNPASQPQSKSPNLQPDKVELFEPDRFKRKFDNIEVIGNGGYGKVYKAVSKLERAVYAIKVIKFQWKVETDIRNEVSFREVLTLVKLSQGLNHRNIVKYNGCWLEFEEDCPDESFQLEDDTIRSHQQNHTFGNNTNTVTVTERQNRRQMESSAISLEDNSLNWSDLGIEMGNDADDQDEAAEQSLVRKSNAKRTNSIRHLLEARQIQPSNNNTKREDEEEKTNMALELKKLKQPGEEVPVLLHIQMEYCSDKTLKDLLEAPERRIDHHKSFLFFTQLVRAVNFIHKHKVIHRDLKPANVFIVKGKIAKIGDFGLAKFPLLQDGDDQQDANNHNESPIMAKAVANANMKRSHSLYQMSMGVGTPLYTAPEQENGNNYDHKVDIYALGLIFLEMSMIFKTTHERLSSFKAIRQMEGLPSAVTANEDLSLQATLIKKMLHPDPKLRPTAGEIMKMSEYQELNRKYPKQEDDDDDE